MVADWMAVSWITDDWIGCPLVAKIFTYKKFINKFDMFKLSSLLNIIVLDCYVIQTDSWAESAF